MTITPDIHLPPNPWRQLAQAVGGVDIDLSDIDGSALINCAEENGVVALLSHRVHAGTATGLAEGVKLQLRQGALRLAAHDMALNAATDRFARLLAQHRLDAIVLKGAATSRIYYPETWLRTRCDIDVWVREADASQVRAMLTRHGYSMAPGAENRVSVRQFQSTPGTATSDAIWFDIHAGLSNRAVFNGALDFDDCLQRACPLPGLDIPTLSATDLMIHTALHRVAHGRNTRNLRLAWLYDVQLIAGQLTAEQWEILTNQAITKRIGGVIANGLSICELAFGTTMPAGRIAALARNAASEPASRLLGAGRWAWAWSDLTGQEGFGKKMRYAWELLKNRAQ